MADLTKTIEIVFNGINNVSGSVKGIGKDLQNLEGSVTDLTQPLANLTGSILKTESAIVGLGAAAIGFSVNEAGKFDTSLREIGTLFDGTGENVAQLSGEVLDFSRTSTSSIERINAAVYQAISTGTDWQDSVSLVAEAEKLATAGRADLTAVTELLTGSMNAYGVSVDSAADYSDVLFTAVQQGKTSIPELASEMTKVTGIAAAAGVPFDDLSAALSALTIYIGDTNIGATALRGLITELLDPSDALVEALGGVTLQGDGLQAVMNKIQEATGGSADKFTELFGNIRAVQAAIALANDNAGTFANSLEAMENRTGRVVKANEALVESYESINQNVANQFRATLIEFGGPLLDEYSEAAQALGNVFASLSFELNAQAFEPITSALEALGLDAAGYLNGIAEALPEALSKVDFGPLLESFGDLQDAFGSLFNGLDLTDADDLAKAIQFVSDSIATLTDLSAGIVESFGPLAEEVLELAKSFVEADGELKNSIGSFLGFGTQVNALVPILGGFGSALEGIANLVLTVAGAKHLGLLTTKVTGLIGLLAGTGGLVAAVGLAGYAIVDFISGLDDTSDEIENLRGSYENWNKAFEGGVSWETAVVRLGEMGESVSHLNDAFVESYGVTADAVAQYGGIAEAQSALANSTEDSIDAIVKQVEAQKNAAVAAGETATNYDELVASVEAQTELADLQTKSNEDLVKAFRALSLEERAYLDEAERAIYVAALEEEGRKNLAASVEGESEAKRKAALTAKELSDEYLRELEILKEVEVELAKLDSAERIRVIELGFDLKLEQLKQDGERAKAIIETIGTTVQSTGDLLGNLFTLFADASGIKRWAIEDQIDLENDRRQQALDMQKELTDAQIELMQAQTANLESGEALINIQADGLEPEIKAFMYKILDNIRVEMSRDNLAFITGVNG